ncbi:serine protease [Variovorax sp. PCZ-1]|uniref:S1C family serine protease n=1 Tax=Variovorax sp. PCZ-1 TaxID=2835533 RepID=UPI001BCB749D|nr:serine protease [Variovorax sp. PCZ-1]MBS7808352.1 trypsin-like peptidase domain-containing protein [Variovorax sp. PCZ-1]
MFFIRCFSKNPSLASASLGFFMLLAALMPHAFAQVPAAPQAPAVTSAAQSMWTNARTRLLRIRIVPIGQTSQASVGSGFFVSSDGLLISNFHVISLVALKPDRYQALYETPSGEKGELSLLGVDVVNDVALLRIKNGSLAAKPTDQLNFRATSSALQRGERIFSLGNPLDVGFAVVEGTYNGLVERSFTPRLFFSGAINGGMSGGPALDAQGKVVGINVAKRLDGEQVSFLVPFEHAQKLLTSHQKSAPITTPLYATITQQLTQYQQQLTDRFMSTPWKPQINAGVSIPIPSDDFLRCWGRREQMESKAFQFARTDCRMDSSVFTGEASLGEISTIHEAYDGSKLGTTRFMDRYSQSFENEHFFSSIRPSTKPLCSQQSIQNPKSPRMEAVLCISAYKRFKGLYSVSILVATQEGQTTGTLGRLNATGVSFDNALKLAQHFVDGFSFADSAAGVKK